MRTLLILLLIFTLSCSKDDPGEEEKEKEKPKAEKLMAHFDINTGSKFTYVVFILEGIKNNEERDTLINKRGSGSDEMIYKHTFNKTDNYTSFQANFITLKQSFDLEYELKAVKSDSTTEVVESFSEKSNHSIFSTNNLTYKGIQVQRDFFKRNLDF